MPFQKLPPELVFEVLDKIDSVKHLAQCRLVCKKWNVLAEKAMFGKEIQLYSDEEIVQFLIHLVKKPNIGNLIKDLHFICDYNFILEPSAAIFDELLNLAFTPTMRKLRGIFTPPIFERMIKIKQESNLHFDKLAIMPLPANESSLEFYYKAALEFKETLSELNLYDDDGHTHLDTVICRLDQFSSLTYITVVYSVMDLPTLENILGRCRQLLKLDLSLEVIYTDIQQILSRNQVTQWIRDNNISQISSLKQIKLSDEVGNPEILEYLLWKYPKTNYFEAQIGFEPRQDMNQDLLRIAKVVNEFPSYNIRFFQLATDQFEYLCSCLKDDKHNLKTTENGSPACRIIKEE